ncbi:MAG: hypothetical protein QF685_01045 [Verrucomicrobiota bacterium]|jgi:hypothetical protein|nr:hypothetical protein [Verrucomicrobiota bacterium]
MIKNKTIIVVLGLGLAMAGFAQSPLRPKGRPLVAKPAKPGASQPASGPTIVRAKSKPSQLLAALDANKDGKLSLKEIEAAVEVLKKLDKNKDGELTLQEFGPTPEKEAIKGPRSLGAPGVVKPPVAASKPSGRPGRRPSAKPSSLPGRKPSALTSRLPGAKKPGARPTRPSAKPRPTARPGRPVAKAGASGTSPRATGASSASAKPKRVARASISGRKSKSASRRRPAGTTAKPAAVATPEDAALKALIGDTEAITTQLKRAMGGMKDSKRKQAALKWVRSGSRTLLRSLNAGLKAEDAAQKAAQAGEAKQKLDEVRKLLE